MDEIAKVALPGSETYWNGYDWGAELEKVFPGQDCVDFAYAVEYNDKGPLVEGRSVVSLVMVEQGHNDENEWVWCVGLDDGSSWQAKGGCDYTGWECQSWLEWMNLASVS